MEDKAFNLYKEIIDQKYVSKFENDSCRWSPLAYKTKKAFPNKNICSIYLLNIKKDYFFKKDYPDELKYIIKNTEPNKSYIINLDYKDTPFKNLIGKYTHIVVY